jgi:hypothetical protein
VRISPNVISSSAMLSLIVESLVSHLDLLVLAAPGWKNIEDEGVAMKTVVQMVDGSDLFSLAVLIGILCFVGSKVARPGSRLYVWGLRLAVLGFVAYGVYGCIAFQPGDAGELAGIAFRGLFAAGLVLGASWIVLAIVAFVYGHTVAGLTVRVRDWWASGRRRAAERRARREQELQRQRDQEEYERRAPERERLRREAEARAQAEAQAQRRREDARAGCELLYALYAPDLGPRFTKEMFHEFVQRHLGDDHDASYVEQRAQQLQALLQQHYEKVHPPPTFKDMMELAAWFEGQKQQIEALPIDGRAKRVHLANLNRRFQELMTEHLERNSP